MKESRLAVAKPCMPAALCPAAAAFTVPCNSAIMVLMPFGQAACVFADLQQGCVASVALKPCK